MHSLLSNKKMLPDVPYNNMQSYIKITKRVGEIKHKETERDANLTLQLMIQLASFHVTYIEVFCECQHNSKNNITFVHRYYKYNLLYSVKTTPKYSQTQTINTASLIIILDTCHFSLNIPLIHYNMLQ